MLSNDDGVRHHRSSASASGSAAAGSSQPCPDDPEDQLSVPLGMLGNQKITRQPLLL